MRVGVLGVSWRHATSATIARFTLPREGRAERLRALARALGAQELVYVATCNRVEVLVAGCDGAAITEWRKRLYAFVNERVSQVGEAERVLRAWEGEGATEHLFLVASGLDSARAGESEIVGQLRAAVAESEEAGLVGVNLRPLLDDAFRVAKRVRPVAEGRIGRASLADVAVARVLEQLRRRPGPVALVGVSPMTEACAASLARVGVPLVIVNRTVARAEALAARYNGRVRSLADFRTAPDDVSALVLATGATSPVLDAEVLGAIAQRSVDNEPPLVVDLGVPPNVRVADATRAGLRYVDMDAVNAAAESGREGALAHLGEARALVDEALSDRRRRQWEALVDPAIIELRRRFEARAHDEVDRALQDELASLDAAERAALRRWTEGLVRRMAHLPTRGLRDLAGRAGPTAAAAFLGTAAPDLAAALQERAARGGAVLEDAMLEDAMLDEGIA
jgi:glutamyl-tRNA reductase